MSSYPHLFSEWQIRNTTIPNRVVFAPTCPTWVADPYEGVFTGQAVAYYEERAKGGCGLIIIGGTIIHPSALYSSFNFPGLWDDKQVDGLAKVAEAVHRHGCKLTCQLLHVGARAARNVRGLLRGALHSAQAVAPGDDEFDLTNPASGALNQT